MESAPLDMLATREHIQLFKREKSLGRSGKIGHFFLFSWNNFLHLESPGVEFNCWNAV